MEINLSRDLLEKILKFGKATISRAKGREIKLTYTVKTDQLTTLSESFLRKFWKQKSSPMSGRTNDAAD